VSSTRIRPFAAGDLDAVVAANDAIGWRGRRGMVSFYVDRPDSALFVADVNGALAGVGGATIFPGTPPTGWVHGIVVHPNHQRAGHGAALTEAAIEWLHARGATTVLLLATDAGRPVYERLGFAAWERYGSFDWPSAGRADVTPLRLRPMTAADHDAVAALDGEASGENRGAYASAFLAAGRVAEADGAVVGFHLPCSWGGGPTIARDPVAGLALLGESARLQPRERLRPLGVPETNVAAMAFLKDCGLAPTRHVTRMTLGPPVRWRPEMVFGVFNFAVG
jgi:GNAT superfamily N-acetyltransferase